jgi:uncharacterized protein (DUF2249 family)
MAADAPSTIDMAPDSARSLRATTRVLGRALRALAGAGRAEEASALAADAWVGLREDAPAEAARLTALLHGLTRLGGRVAPAPQGQPPDAHPAELDVRTDAPARRHELIFDTFAQLAPGTAFVLVNDHDPKPLYYQFAAEHPDDFEWRALEEGPEVWRIRIGRRAGGSAQQVERSAVVPLVELENLATLVVEGLRTRGTRSASITDPEAIDAWVQLSRILRPGQVRHDEPVWLARLLLAVSDVLDRPRRSESAAEAN